MAKNPPGYQTRTQRRIAEIRSYHGPHPADDVVKDSTGPLKARKRRKKQEAPPSLLDLHESAYRSGWRIAKQILEIIVSIRNARSHYDAKTDFYADREFIRGLLDAAWPALNDTIPLMRSKVGLELQQAILDDLWDLAERTLADIEAKGEPTYPCTPKIR